MEGILNSILILFLYAHFPFSPTSPLTPSVSFRKTDPVIHIPHSRINSVTDTTAELQAALKPVISVN